MQTPGDILKDPDGLCKLIKGRHVVALAGVASAVG